MYISIYNLYQMVETDRLLLRQIFVCYMLMIKTYRRYIVLKQIEMN